MTQRMTTASGTTTDPPGIWQEALGAYEAQRHVYEAREERARQARLRARRIAFHRALGYVLFQVESVYGPEWMDEELRRRGVTFDADGLVAFYHQATLHPGPLDSDRRVIMAVACPTCHETIETTGDRLADLGAAITEHMRQCGARAA